MNDCNNSDNEEETVNIVVILYNVHICCVIAGTVFQYSAVVFSYFREKNYTEKLNSAACFYYGRKAKWARMKSQYFLSFFQTFPCDTLFFQ